MVMPGARCILQDGLAVQLSVPPGPDAHPIKYVLSFSGGFLKEEVLMNIHGPPTPCRWDSGWYKGGMSGKGERMRWQDRQVGALMQDLWIVRTRGDSPILTVLIQLHDERVAIAQLSGKEDQCVPPLRRLNPPFERVVLPVWGPALYDRRWMYQRCIARPYRGSLDVPRCHEVLSVVPASNDDILVLHRKRVGAKPEFWVVSPPGAATYRTFFISYTGASSMGHIASIGKGKSNGKGVSRVGSWANNWCPKVPVRLPGDFMDSAESKPFCVELVASPSKEENLEMVRFQGGKLRTRSHAWRQWHAPRAWTVHNLQQDVIVPPGLP